MPSYFNIRRLPLSTTGWTDVIPPASCSVVKILNADEANVQLVRSDKGDSMTEMWLLPSATLVIDSPAETFEPGRVVCSVKAQSGAGPVIAQFIR